MKRGIKIGIIGVGTMGRAILERILKKRIVNKNKLFVNDVNKKKERGIVKKHQVLSFEINRLIKESNFIILAIKPKDFFPLAKEISFPEERVVISIMAGVGINSIKKNLKVKKIVRAMPNLMIGIGEGVIVWKEKGLSQDEIEVVKKIFRALGKEIRVKDENLIDQATLISGCGPGYLYFFEDLLLKSFSRLGFSPDFILKLLPDTFLGAILYQKEKGDNLEKLVKMVATRGGITEKFLETLEEGKINEIFEKAVQNAYQKNIEIIKS